MQDAFEIAHLKYFVFIAILPYGGMILQLICIYIDKTIQCYL